MDFGPTPGSREYQEKVERFKMNLIHQVKQHFGFAHDYILVSYEGSKVNDSFEKQIKDKNSMYAVRLSIADYGDLINNPTKAIDLARATWRGEIEKMSGVIQDAVTTESKNDDGVVITKDLVEKRENRLVDLAPDFYDFDLYLFRGIAPQEIFTNNSLLYKKEEE